MFRIYDGRAAFYQWDTHQKLIIDDNTIKQVHFCNKTDDCAIVMQAYADGALWVVDVPDILLQDIWSIRVYAQCGNTYTKACNTFKVLARSKPADYVYTDIVEAVEELQKEVAELAKGGEAAAEVEALKASVAALSNIVLTLDAPEIEVEVEKEEEPDTPDTPSAQYYIEFSEDAAHQIEDKMAIVEIDGVATTVRSGECYYCETCKIYGQYEWSCYAMEYSGDCSITGNGYENYTGDYSEFSNVTITLQGNVTVTVFREK